MWKKIDKKDKPTSKIGNVSFFKSPTKELLSILNPNIILVGLNVSKDVNGLFQNWHSTSTSAKDYKLRYALLNTPLWGSYMTDIIKKYPEMDSKKVTSYLKKNPDVEKENIEEFKKELNMLGSVNPILIAQGNETYNILKRNIKDTSFTILKVTHYSAHISKEKLRVEYEKLILENEVLSTMYNEKEEAEEEAFKEELNQKKAEKKPAKKKVKNKPAKKDGVCKVNTETGRCGKKGTERPEDCELSEKGTCRKKKKK